MHKKATGTLILALSAALFPRESALSLICILDENVFARTSTAQGHVMFAGLGATLDLSS